MITKSEQKFKMIVENANDAIFVEDAQTNLFVLVNKRACALSGYSAKELSKLGGVDLTPKSHRKLRKEKVKVIFEKGHGTWEHIMLRKNGAEVPVEISSKLVDFDDRPALMGFIRDITERKEGEIIDVLLSAISERDEEGYISRSLAVLDGITARKDAEQALEHSEARLSLIFNSSYDTLGLHELTDKGKLILVEVNATFRNGCEVVGIAEDQYINVDFVKIHTKVSGRSMKQAQELEAKHLEAAKTKEPVTFIDELILPDGNVKYSQITVTPVLDENGKCTHVLGAARNISAEHTASQRIAESEERLKLSAEATGLGIYDWRPLDNVNLCDDRMHEHFGLSPKSKKDRNKYFFSVLHPNDLERVTNEWELFLDPKNPATHFENEYRIRLKKGVVKHISTNGFGFRNKKGEVTRVIGTCLDITSRKDLEEDLRDNVQLLEEAQKIAHMGIWHWNVATGKVTWTQELFKIYGIAEADFKNSYESYIERVHPDDRIIAQTAIGEALKKKKAVTFEERILRPDGEIRYLSTWGGVTRFHKGKVSQMVGACLDITDRKEAERQQGEAFKEVQRLKSQLEQENIYLKEEIKLEHNFEDMIFASQSFQKVLKRVEQVAETDATVLVLGETGTGKELIVRSIHNLSGRRSRPLVKVNCAVLPKELIESELFGHEKGAFTGAIQQKAGKFELADTGTIFLDELGELPLELQAKLLRVLQDGEFERIGGTKVLNVDVRLVAATNRNLGEMVERGEFRADFYYRLNVFPVEVPPLRDRIEDIPLLIQHFVQMYAQKFGREISTIPRKALKKLQAYEWPGNIRELENLVERAIILSSDGVLNFEHFGTSEKESLDNIASGLSLQQVEHAHVLRTVREKGWVITGPKGAALSLGLKPSTLRDRMKKLGIERPAN
ncbi:MAG: sigma 54-interacting transcriptional regulator [Flavobacteriales bacterium]|nr:sigma 54-interacting transcriptional regulator [Flavobacteriales bacterium]